MSKKVEQGLPPAGGTSRIYEPFVEVNFEKNGERAVRYDRLLDDVRGLTGEVLTIVDASVVDEQQNKAIKDLVKGEFRKFLFRYEDICFHGKRGSNPII